MAFGGFERHSGPSQPMSEINVTPLVDVMLVLLVIFMITAPMLHQGIEVALPKANAKNLPLRTERVSEGCLTWSVVHPREVYAPAVRESAGAVIVAHNHPSGDPTPSAQDIEVTARLAKVGELLGIPLLDHIVVGRRRCVSMRAQGLMGSLSVPA